MDFIERLPPLEGHTDILVVVDWLTKQAIFIPTVRSINAVMLVELFIKHVFSKHGAPSHIMSDLRNGICVKVFQVLG